MELERFFDLRIATVMPGEESPPGVHVARVAEPSRMEVAARAGQGWFYKPCYVTYVLRVPRSLEDYVDDAFRSGTRNKPRKLLREVPLRYRLEVDVDARRLAAFLELYRRTIVARPRGRDRVGEHEDGFGDGWTGLHLLEGERLVAGILVHERRDHHSVAYGAFDPEARRTLDLEHYLIMQAVARAGERGIPALSLGMDTNRYGHHLPIGLPAYKLRIGFTPLPWEPAGRETAAFLDFGVFERGLFFYSYEGRSLVGNLFSRGEPDVRPFAHHNAPPVRVFRIP